MPPWNTPTASGFTDAFTTIALIAALLALVGGVLAFVLVRSRDFVSAGDSPAAQASSPSRLSLLPG